MGGLVWARASLGSDKLGLNVSLRCGRVSAAGVCVCVCVCTVRSGISPSLCGQALKNNGSEQVLNVCIENSLTLTLLLALCRQRKWELEFFLSAVEGCDPFR